VEHGEKLGQLQLSTIHQNQVAFKVWQQFMQKPLRKTFMQKPLRKTP
jgi:hypothetical protein